MPFFTQLEWINGAGKVWVWVALTVPSTIMIIMFYLLHTRRELRKRRGLGVTDELELNGSSG
jgi:hypothetical protein